MSRPSSRTRVFVRASLIVCLLAGLVGWAAKEQADQRLQFTRQTIDLGVVVSDIDKALKFYKDGLGFTEVEGFDVPADFARDSGLTDGHPFHVHVLVLGEDETATRLKLMQFKQAPGRRIDNAFIHSSYGFSYLTIFVADIDAALARAAEQGVKPLADGPVALPEGFPEGIYLANVRDPDGNIIELLGPKAE